MSSALDSYQLQYEDINPITRKGGKDSKMSKAKQTVEAPVAKSYNKTRGEHFKDLVIVALVVGIIAFVGGMQFAKGNQAQIDKAVNAVTQTEQVSAEAKK